MDLGGDRIPSTDGVELQTYDFGGEGPLVVMCHATGFCGAVWHPVAEVLRSRYRCVALDFRAHGASTAPEDGVMRWSGMADDVTAVVEHYGDGGPVRGVGHSLGGGSLVLAEAAGPGMIDAAWLFEPILFGPARDDAAPAPSEMSNQARLRRNRFPSRDDIFDRYHSRPPLNLLDERCLRAYVEYGFVPVDPANPEAGLMLACTPEHEARVFEQHMTGADQASRDLGPSWALAVGEGTGVVTDAVEAAAEANPDLQLIHYDDLSHFGPLEAPDLLAVDILAWFDDTSG